MQNLLDQSIVQKLKTPLSDSHKGQNGKVLIIAGSEKYHGAVVLAAMVASKIVDLVYVSSTSVNNKLIEKMKPELAEFITVSRDELEDMVIKVDAVLIGPGLGVSAENKKLVNHLVSTYEGVKFVLDADALKMIEPKLLHQNCVVTPHAQEFEMLFQMKPSEENVLAMANKFGCVIVLKGKNDYVSNGKELCINKTGNAGMTKGGTGDVLAGLITALASQNELFLSACAGVYINGLAGDSLKEKVAYYYNASDLIAEIPKVLKSLTFS